LLAGDGFYGVENVLKSILAWASPKTPLGELAAPPRPHSGGEGASCPSPRTRPPQEAQLALDLAVSTRKHP